MEMKDIVERIIYFRDIKTISARELSLSLGKSENYISKLECLDFIVPSDILLKIINNLGIMPEEFFAEDYKNYKTKKAILSLLEDIAKCVPEEKIIELLNSLKKY
ncbi:MAG: helix-turn-helix transcriptional regulator [Clostridia bacterium]|nr:helix-turn-helix transcriptional regulator [Clostridia bacterium]